MPTIIGFVPGGEGLEWTVRVAANASYVAGTVVRPGVALPLGASQKDAKWRWITPGALLSVVAPDQGKVLADAHQRPAIPVLEIECASLLCSGDNPSKKRTRCLNVCSR
ncbi:MAG: hypothetical protein KJ944_07170 [Alphaproteobacteria bacterium]|nr:hypothetical protein [Alphaproteobacteria bacterium]MBU1561655.1 hypothetical protein [Alphaproteobacteria bacterium]MBU2302364.1 hypothetical protein [Alphaproteobacteria bacterium]MBU2368644.1 hypothetical protein [Alphaproteobacteria bacterium]